jgi:lysophospholipase L1-like esterase
MLFTRMSLTRSLHLALGLVAVLVAPLALAACSQASPSSPSATPTPGANSPVYYTAVGASDAAGVGSSSVCVPFSECPDGMGYVPVIARALGQGGATVTLMNMGIPAAVIGPDIEAIGKKYNRTIPGNFLENEVPFLPRNSTVVTVFAGANDVNTLGDALDKGEGGSDPWGWTDQQINAFKADFDALIRGIRDRAPQAKIVVANLPNMAGMPYAAGYTLVQKQAVQKMAVGFDTQAINPYAAQGVAIVDMMCDARSYQASIYSSDGFHPNDSGYQYIAGEMLKAMNGSYPSPQSGCGYMTVVTPH